MKKSVVFSSLLATFLFCFSLLAKAQDVPTVETGRTGTVYMSDAYVGVPNTAEFWITGKHLTGDISFVGYSEDDGDATYNFSPATVEKSQAGGYNQIKVEITPRKVSHRNTYYIQPVSSGLSCAPIVISFPVLDTVPAFTDITTEPLSGDFYVGESYTREMYVQGNTYVTDDVYFEIPEGSDVVSLSEYVVSASKVKAEFGHKLLVTFKPSKASVDSSERLSFPIVIKTKGMADYTTHAMACYVKDSLPELTVTAGGYGKNVYVNTSFTKTIYVQGNDYLKGDITLVKKNAGDDIVFSPAVVTKEAAMSSTGAAVDVTVTPSEVTSERTYFYFTVSTEGYSKECSVWCWEVADQSPAVSLVVGNGGYIVGNATKGEPFNVMIRANANGFTTDSVYFFSEDAQVTAFTPSAVGADDAQNGVDVKVTIIPAKGSTDAYEKQSFVVKAKTKGAREDAETTIQFVVLPVEVGTGLDDVRTDKEAVKVMENGQLYIIHDGVRYSVLGTKVINN